MTHSQAIKKLHKDLYNDYRKPPYLSSWRQYLDICREIASEKKQYDRASLIMDLIRFDTIEPGPHTDNELNELLTY